VFTHQVVPLHIESLIEFLQSFSPRKLTREELKMSFQPSSVSENQTQSNNTIAAALELQLLEEKEDKSLGLIEPYKKKGEPKTKLLQAIETRVLNTTEVEYYFALFYSYILGLNNEIPIVASQGEGEAWATRFNRDVFNNIKQTNPFNKDKYGKLFRWIVYSGLGWLDPSNQFNCNPFERIKRSLKTVFGKSKKLECDDFLVALAEACPELDRGKIFLEANKKYDEGAKRCTLGLSQALVDLHVNGFLKLHCPMDSDGWSIALASPPNDGKSLASNRISQVELGKGGGK